MEKYTPLTFFKNLKEKGLKSALEKEVFETVKSSLERPIILMNYMMRKMGEGMAKGYDNTLEKNANLRGNKNGI